MRIVSLPKSIVFVFITALLGCAEPDQITSYQAPKTKTISRPTATGSVATRMLASYTIEDGKAWFFKVMGPDSQVQAISNDFDSYIASINFESGKPTFDLPKGWKQKPSSSAMRFATIEIPGEDKPLELSVIRLPVLSEPSKYALDNINRWRGQVQLEPLTAATLNDNVTKSQVNGKEFISVNLLGKSSGGGAPMAPFANRKPPFAGGTKAPTGPRPNVNASPSSSGSGKSGLTYETPEGWKPSAGSSMSAAAFAVNDGDKQLKITITPLGGAAGGVLSNVNRWRGQVGLGSVSDADLASITEKLEVDGTEATYVAAHPEADAAKQQSILGIIMTKGSTSWFVKAHGDTSVAKSQEAAFKKFCLSLKLP